jgi:hypothetical protein
MGVGVKPIRATQIQAQLQVIERQYPSTSTLRCGRCTVLFFRGSGSLIFARINHELMGSAERRSNLDPFQQIVVEAAGGCAASLP